MLILDAPGLIRPEASNPTITTTIRCQKTMARRVPNDQVPEGTKCVRQASTPVERILIYMRIDAEIKDDTRRANSLRTFNLGLAPQVYSLLSVKEVIQPQVPLRLPCYDFAPVTALAFGRLLLLRGCDTDFGRSQLPWRDGRCVQGPGTYSRRRS